MTMMTNTTYTEKTSLMIAYRIKISDDKVKEKEEQPVNQTPMKASIQFVASIMSGFLNW